eukprot:s4526_g2.t3
MAVPAMQIELPGHIYLADLAALEEQLLVGAYRRLCGVQVGAACPPVTTTASRNDLIAMAHEHLGGPDLRAFLNYAESLDSALEGQVIVDLSRPIGSHDNTAPPAEQLAWHFLKEGKGSVWASVRAAVSQLRWETDSRAFAQGNGLRWACLPNLEAAGQSIHFQTTIPAAGGSRTAAAVIARSCYVKFEEGWTKDRVRDFRNQCYAKLGGRVLTSSPPQKSFSQGTKESLHDAKESDPRAVASRGQSKSQAQCKGHRAHLMPETLHPAKRPRIDESPTSPTSKRKLQSSNSKNRVPGGQAAQVFLQPRDLKLILDDPQASLPQKEVRSIRSQGLGLGSQAIPGPASQPEVSGLQAARHAAADLEAPRGQAENSDTGFNGFFGCCGCCCQAHRRAAAASGVRQKCPPPGGSQGRIITCSGRDQSKVSGNPNPGKLACGDSSPNVERDATTVAAAVQPPAPSAGVYRAQQQILKHEVREGDAEEGSQLLESGEHSTASAPESQHRPESQPTPFCWDLPVAKIEESVPDSLPPFIDLQEPVALPASLASIPVPDPPPLLESLPTPWFSQPTPQVQLSDLRYVSDLTPVPPKQEEDGLPGLPSSSIPPVPLELASGDQNCQRQMASQASAAAAPAVPSKPTGEPACDPQDSPFATSLDVLSLTRDRLPPASFKQASDMAKPDSNFAALLLQRSRAAAASRGEAQRLRDSFKKEPLRKQRPLEDADSIDLPPAPCLTAVGRATI